MRINWKIRIMNPQFWLQIALAIVVPIGGYYGITGADISTWGTLFDVSKDAVMNPYVLFTVAASVYFSIADPTTRGFNDSYRALTYDKPADSVRK